MSHDWEKKIQCAVLLRGQREHIAICSCNEQSGCITNYPEQSRHCVLYGSAPPHLQDSSILLQYQISHAVSIPTHLTSLQWERRSVLSNTCNRSPKSCSSLAANMVSCDDLFRTCILFPVCYCPQIILCPLPHYWHKTIRAVQLINSYFSSRSMNQHPSKRGVLVRYIQCFKFAFIFKVN